MFSDLDPVPMLFAFKLVPQGLQLGNYASSTSSATFDLTNATEMVSLRPSIHPRFTTADGDPASSK